MNKIIPAKPEERWRWVDCAKGVCIVLVVYGHVTGGLVASGGIRDGSIYDQVRSWVYLFHMPAFFFLSGLFARQMLGRTLGMVWSARIRTLVYPYVLWTGIYLLVQEIMARHANHAPDVARAAHFLWEPYGYGLWFLYSLFLISLLYYAISLLRMPKPAVLLGAVVLSVAGEFNVFGFWPILNTAMLYLVFYVVGGLYVETVSGWLAARRSPFWFGAGLLFLGLMTFVAWTLGRDEVPAGLMVAWLGIAGVVCLARGMADGVLGGVFAPLGFCSLEIYLGHPLFSVAARAGLSWCGCPRPAIYVISEVFCGVLLSFALAVFCRRYRFPYLFKWPA
jgi:fucose 4-O-acetylase-like acetyltransferase